MCKEYTTPEIVNQLGLSTCTIEGYRNRLIKMTHSKNKALDLYNAVLVINRGVFPS
jgi:DNA-binding CsgD family transcriptional regulator